MDPADLEKKITRKTKAVIPVHMYGSAARMDEILAIARARKLLVLEDAAQAVGGQYKGRRLGTLGDAGTFSFDFGKTLTTGEGGMIGTDRKEVYDAAREFADHGHEDNPKLPRGEDTRKRRGFNYRMMELQGAIGLAQLKKLEGALKTQKENKRRIKEAIRDVQGIEFRRFADEPGETADVLVFFVKDVPTKDRFVLSLKEKGIGTKNLPDAINWHFAGTWQHIFKEVPEYSGKDVSKMFARSEGILRRAISIPIVIKMDDKRIEHVIGSIREIAAKVQPRKEVAR
jgi:8-amino-3,8-dideoxy-alpha-D-manno-octulosonate transaminase